MSESRLSIAVVNFNAGARLMDCVRSVLDQCDELIVVDNASHDGSMIEVEQTASGQPKIRVVLNSQNVGFARACNISAGIASGELILFLNPDCILHPGAVAAMRRALSTYAKAGMVGGLLLNPNGTEQAGGRRLVPTPWRSFVRVFGLQALKSRYPRLFEGYDLHLKPLPHAPEEVEAISGACMLVSKQALDDVGMLDEAYFMHCEDLDWCMRFRQKGWKIFFVPDALVIHHKGTCSKARPVFVEWHKHRGMVRFYRKFFRHQYPGGLMWLVILAVWLRFLAITSALMGQRIMNKLRSISR
ncbi:MAG: dTDP-Rha--alpha-D-GlcNAc-pyrophosphate polyprenol alpha-3-L-rhamnosyltransferase [Rhodocyclales bacterium]|nr:dTDP-Rha--alpha-D-GlcNAc-pyrophosphate polyprenol alpha-3-L-rhamnosyltransferase [Rhodocyclales bacterium]